MSKFRTLGDGFEADAEAFRLTLTPRTSMPGVDRISAYVPGFNRGLIDPNETRLSHEVYWS